MFDRRTLDFNFFLESLNKTGFDAVNLLIVVCLSSSMAKIE